MKHTGCLHCFACVLNPVGHFTLLPERRSVAAARFSKRCKAKKLQSYNFTTL